MTESTTYNHWLKSFLDQQGGCAGTVHVLRDGELHLAAAVNIPPPVMQVVERVPKGKGMAGLAFERKTIIHTCSLKDDNTGNVRPGAKAVDAQAAAAIPVIDTQGQVLFVVGIAFDNQREFAQSELDAIAAEATSVQNSPI